MSNDNSGNQPSPSTRNIQPASHCRRMAPPSSRNPEYLWLPGGLIAILALTFGLLALPTPSHATNPALRVAFNSTMTPFQFIRHDEASGMHIDMLDWIGRTKGLQFQYIPFNDNNECLAALANGHADIVLGYKVDSASYRFQSTGELSSTSLCMITSNELATILDANPDYNTRTAALEYGSMSFTYMYKLGLKNYYVYGNQHEVFRALVSHTVDIAVGVKESLLYMLTAEGLSRDYTIIHNYMAPISYSMLVRPQDGELFMLLDTGISELRAKGEYELIYRRWVVNTELIELEKARRTTELLVQAVVVVALVAALIIGFNTRMNLVLKRLVGEKTMELQAANAKLQQRMAQLTSEGSLRNSIIENSPGAMVFFDNAYNITLINAAALRIAGLGAHDSNSGMAEPTVGTDIRNLTIFGDILKRLEELARAESDDVPWLPVVVDLEQAGRTRSFRCNLYRSSHYSSIAGMLLTVEDVTREEREKQELFEAEKNKSLNRLVAGIAHEIKNPLMSIRTAATLIKTQGDDPEVKEAFANFVPGEVQRINQLIEGLINYAKPVKGDAQDLDLSALIKDCLYLAQIAGKRAHIKLNADITDGLIVHARKNQLKQSLINIIMNGIESLEQKQVSATGTAGPLYLDIRAHADGAKTCIVIRDTGIGMNAQELRQCASPFFTTKASGTGLGLAIARQYIQENNGTLTIESLKDVYTQITLTFRRF